MNIGGNIFKKMLANQIQQHMNRTTNDYQVGFIQGCKDGSTSQCDTSQ